jgi:hypothetical protein
MIEILLDILSYDHQVLSWKKNGRYMQDRYNVYDFHQDVTFKGKYYGKIYQG